MNYTIAIEESGARDQGSGFDPRRARSTQRAVFSHELTQILDIDDILCALFFDLLNSWPLRGLRSFKLAPES